MTVESPADFFAIFGNARESIEEGGTGTVLLDRPEVDDGDSLGYDDWYVLRGSMVWHCGCGFESDLYCEVQDPHRIIVWPSEDDPNIAKAAKEFIGSEEHQQVDPYERSMGPCLSWYKLRPS